MRKWQKPWAERGGGFSPNTTELAESQARLRHAKPLTELYEVHTHRQHPTSSTHREIKYTRLRPADLNATVGYTCEQRSQFNLTTSQQLEFRIKQRKWRVLFYVTDVTSFYQIVWYF